MISYCYDIECFKNLFTAIFVNVNDENDRHVFYVGPDKNDYGDIKKFLEQEMVLIGYNNHQYDDPMLRFIMNYKGDKLNSSLYTLSSNLINDSYNNDRQILELRYPKKSMFLWKSIDLMKILAFDKLGISLKQTAINLKWHKIQDIPISPMDNVMPKDLQLILDYNLNDVLITKKLYEEIEPIRKLRDDLSKLYFLDFSSASDSKVANLILESIYAKELKTDIRSIKDMRTPREKVLLGTCIAKFVKFKTPELNALLERVSTTYVYAYNNFKYNESISFANCTFSLGVGGLHTEDTPGKFETTDTHIIQDMDVASYYPNLIINNKFYPEHLGPRFISVLKGITNERLASKKAGDKVKSEGLKITINSIFGKTGSQFYWLYDPKQFLSTTISGQMGLLMLVESMYLNKIEVLSCNTDGVVCRIPVESEKRYYNAVREWEEITGLTIEFTKYKKYIRRDVNSYITEKENGEVKEKGAFLTEIDLKKAYHMPIVAKAIHNYFIKEIPVRKTLEDCNDIMEFCISQKSGKNFTIELHSGNKVEKLQKTNRFYITTRGGALLKREMFSGRLIGLYVGRQVRILNDYDASVPFSDYQVDLAFYEKEIMKILDEIEPKQLKLFELPSDNFAKKTSNKENSAPVSAAAVDFVPNIDKLGKNQLISYIETVVNNRRKIKDISPRYVYIRHFDHRTMTATIYCLAKSITQDIVVDKSAYKKAKIETGQIVYCNKFDKEQKLLLLDYEITEKIRRMPEKMF